MAPVRASQAPAFPSIARVSHHGIGEILVNYFVIKVYCPVPEFIGAVFVKKPFFSQKSPIFFAKTGFIYPSDSAPSDSPPRLRPIRNYPSNTAPFNSPPQTPPPLHWRGGGGEQCSNVNYCEKPQNIHF
jgi:hypothetical protein